MEFATPNVSLMLRRIANIRMLRSLNPNAASGNHFL